MEEKFFDDWNELKKSLHDITAKGVVRCALLSQASSYSALRLYKKLDRISETEFARICSKLGWLLLKITP